MSQADGNNITITSIESPPEGCDLWSGMAIKDGTRLQTSPVVVTADPFAALTMDLSRLKSPEPAPTTKVWPVSPILIAAITSQINFRLMSAMAIPAAARFPATATVT